MADGVAPPRWLKHVNKLLMVMLRLGVPISRHEAPVVLTVPGRKTGKPRSTPVTPMHIDGKRYVVNGYPGADWVRNVRAARQVTLTQGRRSEQVRMVELRADDARPVLREFPGQVATGRRPDEACGRVDHRLRRRIGRASGSSAGVSHRPRRVASHGMSDSARIRPPWWLKYVNKAMIGVQKLGFGFGGKGPLILTVPGRKSGKMRSTPITPMIVDGKRYVLGGLPGSDWAANARAAGEVELRQGRNTERVRMVELPPDEARPLLRLFPVEVPTGVGFMKNAGLITGPNPDEYEALAGRCPVFRVDLLR